MTALSFDALPHLPQCDLLKEIAPTLWQQESVRALWVGGSLARGEADRYSDIDLRMAVAPETLEAWKRPDFGMLFHGLCLTEQLLSFGEGAFLHHLLLRNGDIYDLWVQSAEQAPSAEAILILGCRDAALRERLEQTAPLPPTPYPLAEKQTVRALLEGFWINSHKHRKVLHRNLHLLALTGVQADRAVLQRLWYIQATGRDYGATRTETIHGLTERTRTVEKAQGARALEILGADLSSHEHICRALERIREEVSTVGLDLALTLDFDYPHALEETVQRCWAEYLGGW